MDLCNQQGGKIANKIQGTYESLKSHVYHCSNIGEITKIWCCTKLKGLEKGPEVQIPSLASKAVQDVCQLARVFRRRFVERQAVLLDCFSLCKSHPHWLLVHTRHF